MSVKAILGAILAVSAAAATPQAQAQQGVVIEIAGPVWLAKGRVIGGTVRRTVKLNESIEAYQWSGRTLCAAGSADAEKPAEAGFGWRLQLTPIGPGTEAGSFIVAVEWQRLWDRGVAIKGATSHARVTLVPGQHTMLDFLNATPQSGIYYFNKEGIGCDALGMGLQIGIPATESNEVAEANVWLVRSRDGATLERQTIRARIGTANEFNFRNIDVAGATLRTRGRLTVSTMTDKSVTFFLDVSQEITGATGIAADALAGGAGVEFENVQLGSVVEVKMPRLGSVAASKGDQLSMRIQIARLK